MKKRHQRLRRKLVEHTREIIDEAIIVSKIVRSYGRASKLRHRYRALRRNSRLCDTAEGCKEPCAVEICDLDLEAHGVKPLHFCARCYHYMMVRDHTKPTIEELRALLLPLPIGEITATATVEGFEKIIRDKQNRTPLEAVHDWATSILRDPMTDACICHCASRFLGAKTVEDLTAIIDSIDSDPERVGSAWYACHKARDLLGLLAK